MGSCSAVVADCGLSGACAAESEAISMISCVYGGLETGIDHGFGLDLDVGPDRGLGIENAASQPVARTEMPGPRSKRPHTCLCWRADCDDETGHFFFNFSGDQRTRAARARDEGTTALPRSREVGAVFAACVAHF